MRDYFFSIDRFSRKRLLEAGAGGSIGRRLFGRLLYNRSTHKEKLGKGRPVPLRRDGVQQRVWILCVSVQKKVDFVDRERK